MSGNARFHDKLHRANHHTLSTSGLLDSAYDPIASPDFPFRGDFILSGGLSALGGLTANNLNILSEIKIDGNSTTQNQTIIGKLKLSLPSYGGTAIYAQNASTNPNNYTLSINYENGVFVSNDLTVYGTITGNLPSINGITPNTKDISNAYVTLRSNSATIWSYQGLDIKSLTGNWQSTYNTVNSNSATIWSYQGLDIKPLTGNWQSTYNTVNSNSASWSAAAGSAGADLTVRALTGNWQSTYNTVNSNSASWSNTGLTTEDVQDTVNTLLSAGKGISIIYDDNNNKLELSTTANLSTSTGLTPGYYPLANGTNRLEDGTLRQSGPSIFLSNNDATFYTNGSNSHIYTTGSNSHIYTNSGNISSRSGNLFLSAGNVLAPTGIVSAASANFVNLSSSYVRLQSYSETSISLTPTSLSPVTYDLDLSKGTVFQITLQANVNGGIALQNIPPGVNSFLLIITQNGTGGWGISSWAWLVGKTLKWSGGAPTVTSTANATDIYSFMSVDGNTWYGSVAGKNFV